MVIDFPRRPDLPPYDEVVPDFMRDHDLPIAPLYEAGASVLAPPAPYGAEAPPALVILPGTGEPAPTGTASVADSGSNVDRALAMIETLESGDFNRNARRQAEAMAKALREFIRGITECRRQGELGREAAERLNAMLGNSVDNAERFLERQRDTHEPQVVLGRGGP